MITQGAKSYRKCCKLMDGPFGRRYYAILYVIEAPMVARIKIGRSLDIADRFQTLDQNSCVPLSLLGHVWLPDDAERYAHTQFAKHSLRGEWFSASPSVRAFANMIAAKDIPKISAALEMDYMLIR